MEADVLMEQYKMLTVEQQKQVESMIEMFRHNPAQKRQADNTKERTLGLAKGLFAYDGLEELDTEVAKMFEAS